MSYKKKAIITRLLAIILPLFTILGLLFFKDCLDTQYFISPDYKSVQFNLMTINSILLGFMFTTLGIFISAIETESLRKNQGYIGFDLLVWSIISGLIFVSISFVLNIIIIILDRNVFLVLYKVLIGGEIAALIAGILAFVFSVKDSISLMKELRKKHKKVSKDELDRFK